MENKMMHIINKYNHIIKNIKEKLVWIRFYKSGFIKSRPSKPIVKLKWNDLQN